MQTTTFKQWKKEVDAVLLRKVGLTSESLPDVDYWGLYQACGDSPEEAADFDISEAQSS